MDGVLSLDQSAGDPRGSTEAVIAHALNATRDVLGMGVAYVTEADAETFRLRAVAGDGAAFGLVRGARVPRRDTLSDMMLAGAIANVVADVAATPGARDATGSRGAGAYVGVPVRLADGTVYGSLCCISAEPSPALRERDARLLETIAELIAERIDLDRTFAPAHASQPESELRALIAVASAVAAAHRLEDVLEVVAEETRRVVGASSVSISRWEREHARVRTLINVGELGPDEERFPTEETYDLADYPLAARLLREGESYVVSRGDAGLGPHDRQLLEALDKASYIGVPVIFDGRTWGKLEAFANVGATPFTRRHVPFLEAIAGQVGAAIGRAELFSRVNALAYSDPLTGLANRRALDERLEAAIARGTPVAIAFCDLDGLKRLNDTLGHDAGDRAIQRTGEALAEAAGRHPDSYVCRVGGDEFCAVMEGRDAAAAAALAAEASSALAEGDEPLALSCGIAALRPGNGAAELFRAADAAQYAAKREGGARVVVAGAMPQPALGEPAAGRRERRERPGAWHRAVAEQLLAELDGVPEAERAERLAQALGRLGAA